VPIVAYKATRDDGEDSFHHSPVCAHHIFLYKAIYKDARGDTIGNTKKGRTLKKQRQAKDFRSLDLPKIATSGIADSDEPVGLTVRWCGGQYPVSSELERRTG
jgi:hypothetical protein